MVAPKLTLVVPTNPERSKKPTVSLQERRRAETRSLILEAAAEVFTDVGFQDATVEQISSTAGISRGTFYLHFRDKADVSIEIGTRSQEPLRLAYSKLAALPDPDLEQVEKWTKNFVKLNRTDLVGLEVGLKSSTMTKSFADQDGKVLHELSDAMAAHVERFDTEEQEAARTRVMFLQVMTSNILFQWLVREVPLGSASIIIRSIADIWMTELAKAPRRRVGDEEPDA